MRVYIASWFNSKDEMKVHAKRLQDAGIEVTSRWLEEKIASNVAIADVEDGYLRATAQTDIEDILLANVLVLNVPSKEQLESLDMPIASWARGGRHFESGFQYATMLFYKWLPDSIRNRGHRSLILVGHKENVFHFLDEKTWTRVEGINLPYTKQFDTWELACTYLAAKAAMEPILRN